MWESVDLDLLSNALSITGTTADFSRYAAAYEREAKPARIRMY